MESFCQISKRCICFGARACYLRHMVHTFYTDDLGNAVRASTVRAYQGEVFFRQLALKSVWSGKEVYTIDGRKHTVQAGEWILGNAHHHSAVEIDSHEASRGLCVDLSFELFEEAFGEEKQAAQAFDFLCSEDFPLLKGRIAGSSLQDALTQLFDAAQTEPTNVVHEELLVALAEAMMEHLTNAHISFQRIPAQEPPVKRDLHRRLLHAKQFIEEECLNTPSLDDIALEASVSKFHFVRLFKASFGVTPYQYLSQRRLDWAGSMIRQHKDVQEVALHCGFADTASFSKAFRKHFSVSPTAYQRY